MNDWLESALALAQQGQAAVLVTVAATTGSAPREAGAHLLVGAGGLSGSIGGGHLEYQAIQQARRMLAQAGTATEALSSLPPTPQLQRFALGASLGQCCGGAVRLLFERLGPPDLAWLQQALQWQRCGVRWCRVVQGAGMAGQDAMREPMPVRVLALDDTAALHGLPAALQQALASLQVASGEGPADPALLFGPQSGTGWTLLDCAPQPPMPVWLFGAGHVGRALVRILAGLPMRVSWVDSRIEAFPAQVAPHIQVCCTDTPEDEVGAAPPGAAFVVLTHDHALDFELSRRILARGDFRFFGLIGSQTKRLSFTQRLRARGVDDAQIARMTCPVGVAGIEGKEPEVIAVAIAAQLLQSR
ncbi:xanthine dehydrogenase accessory protein XdhC [Corticibacter populi]|uniref:Xanthine dehydrogenase accessory protein XdhC n=1 Tax=Corticibacter populi TaxID=1550736 RepID=A0A3M6QMB2_9BURK|nr:xanthine dehydrogenase accessory protein XdhC [Corticibacter populi]RMX04223.1 xanthine dehydrogenase accessory protein XdhC [Corticibacter populi]RZS33257.1 xanthine dehydrogenase accessory factor [Corticibacter populi]